MWFFILTTAFASALHGAGDFLGDSKWRLLATKTPIVVTHICLNALVGFPYAAAAGVWWVLFRRGAQAKAELNYIDGKGGVSEIKEAYPKLLGEGAAWVAEKIHGGIFGERRQQEFFVTLCVTAPALGVVAWLFNLFI